MQQARFDVEYDHVSEFLGRFALRLTQDPTLAQDLVQDTVYRALSNCERFEEGTNFKAWISTIMRNTFVSGYRKRSRRPVEVPSMTQAEEHRKAASRNDGPSNLSVAEMHKQLADLDERYVRPFTLYYSGYRYEEIATLMQLPLGTVKSRIFTARKQLKDRLRHLR